MRLVRPVRLVGVAPLHARDERLVGVEPLLVPRLEVAEQRGLALALLVSAADLEVARAVVVEVGEVALEQHRVQHHRRAVVDEVARHQQLPLLERPVADVEGDVGAGVRRPVVAGRLVDDVDHRRDRRAAGRGAQPAGPVRLAALGVRPPPRDHLHGGRAAPVGAVLLRDAAAAEDLSLVGVVAPVLDLVPAVGVRRRGGPGRGAGGHGSTAYLGVPREEAVRQRDALDLVTDQPDLRHRAGGLGELGAFGPRALGGAHPGGLPEGVVRREVTGRGHRGPARGGTLDQADRLRAHLRLRAVGPAGAEAVALALEGRAPHDLVHERACRRGDGSPTGGGTGFDDAVDGPSVRRGDPAVAGGQRPGTGDVPGRADGAVVPASARDEREHGQEQDQGPETDPACASHGEDLETSGVTSPPLSTMVTGESRPSACPARLRSC